MCLTVTSTEKNYKKSVKVAEEDIVCWKVVTVDNYGKVLTAYRDFPVQLGKRLRAKGKIKCARTVFKLASGEEVYYHDFEGGLIHTYADKRSAYLLASDYSITAVVKCIIPKGSKYYEGDFFRDKGYASKNIIVTKEIFYAGFVAKTKLKEQRGVIFNSRYDF